MPQVIFLPLEPEGLQCSACLRSLGMDYFESGVVMCTYCAHCMLFDAERCVVVDLDRHAVEFLATDELFREDQQEKAEKIFRRNNWWG